MPLKFNWSSFKRAQTPKTIGSKLEVGLPLLGIDGVVAKVDTGAFSGALHATRIREITNKSGERRLRFSPVGSIMHTIEVESFHSRKVKSSNGDVSIRYAIDTEVSIQGHNYPITITLADRKNMRHHMLIGRNFLRLHGFLVDVTSKNA